MFGYFNKTNPFALSPTCQARSTMVMERADRLIATGFGTN
jgi:hypothetical protein